ncbi:fused MFS/spermidine synthase [bacterium]|nr:fused MFS/spermidine synthase [bacterium]
MFILLNLSVFLSAYLLFSIELITANALLPGFGGSYLVWSSCMMFFQGLLFLGYLYANIYRGKLNLRRTFVIHVTLILLPALFFPIHLDRFQNPAYAKSMIIEILGLLLLTIGLAFWILSSTSVILQQYLALSTLTRNKNPYVLYAVSNLGSVIALCTYPLVVTPLFRLQTQITGWQIGYLVFVLLHLLLLIFSQRLIPHTQKKEPRKISSPPAAQIFHWILLSASASALLLAVTNTITFDLAAIPLFWIVPLSIYLMSFILTFKHKMWFPSWLKDRFSLAVIIGIFLFLLMLQSYRLPVPVLFILHPLILFLVCMTCHGELVQSKPDSVRYMPLFYIVISLGSFLGSILVSWIIPLISTSIVEYPIALFLAVLALSSMHSPEKRQRPTMVIVLLIFVAVLVLWPLLVEMIKPQTGNLFAAGFGLIIALIFYALRNMKIPFTAGLILVILFSYFIDQLKVGQDVLHKHRNFYGIYRVIETEDKRYLRHGTTLHGSQYIRPDRRHEALTYYHITAPSGEMLSHFSSDIHDVGLVGLGAGSLLTYVSEKQTADVFELDPYNRIVAEKYFFFIENCAGALRMFFGDARVSLRKITDRQYTVLIIDAFNSDAIPVHLLTLEAISEYFDHMQPDGILLFHISNKYLDLSPVILANGRALDLFALKKRYIHNIHPDAEACEWAVLTKNAEWARRLVHELHWTDLRIQNIKTIPPWTDQYTNILAVVR